MSGLTPKLVRLTPKMKKTWDFLRSVSVHVLKLILKSPRFVPFEGLSDQICAKTETYDFLPHFYPSILLVNLWLISTYLSALLFSGVASPQHGC